jgi:hypothetical protein
LQVEEDPWPGRGRRGTGSGDRRVRGGLSLGAMLQAMDGSYMEGDFSDEHKLEITESLLRANATVRKEEGWAVGSETFDRLLDNRTALRRRLGRDTTLTEMDLAG